MLRKMLVLGLLVTSLSMATCVLAEDVVVTSRGSKYHKPECRLIKNKENVTIMTKEEAKEADYQPCGRCYKEDKVIEEKAAEK